MSGGLQPEYASSNETQANQYWNVVNVFDVFAQKTSAGTAYAVVNGSSGSRDPDPTVKDFGGARLPSVAILKGSSRGRNDFGGSEIRRSCA
jgi:hypothetical protein